LLLTKSLCLFVDGLRGSVELVNGILQFLVSVGLGSNQIC
jgi:hypothetical protein